MPLKVTWRRLLHCHCAVSPCQLSLIVIAVVTVIFLCWQQSFHREWPEAHNSIPQNFDLRTSNLEPGTCRIPNFSPNGSNSYALDISDLYDHDIPHCIGTERFNMFEIDLNFSLVRLNTHDPFWKDVNCFYSSFRRDPEKPDFQIVEDKRIYEVTSDVTPLPENIENIQVWCNQRGHPSTTTVLYRDYLSTIRVRPSLEETLSSKIQNISNDHYSVAIFGMDSPSHMSFRRFMPQSNSFLINELDAIEFHGFNSLGPGTLWSVFPLLAGQDLNELRDGCWKKDGDYFDECPWIWKDLEMRGYRTSYAEDDVYGSHFNEQRSRRGFQSQPTHYDFRQVAIKLAQSVIVNGIDRLGGSGCYGAKLTWQVLLDRLLKVSSTFKDRSFFHFSWSAELTHNRNALGQYGDSHLHDTLKRMRDLELLENTILILFSDHGMRYGKLRRTTRQGFLEERLPVLYIVLPPKFRNKYPKASENMRENVHRLTSAFDVHSTIKDLLDATQIKDEMIEKRSANLTASTSRAISLFLPVSSRRTCKDLGLNFVSCACENLSPISTSNKHVRGILNPAVEHINAMLDGHTQCQKLELWRATRAFNSSVEHSMIDKWEQRSLSKSSETTKEITSSIGQAFVVEFETKPIGIFQVAATKIENAVSILHVNRISEYGNDGKCVEKYLRPFCHCL